MEKRWGIPPWAIDFHPAARPLPASVDFAVIGGGFTGLSAAAWLRRLAPDQSVAVLEADCLGAGASGRTGGMVLAESAAGDLPGLGDVLGGFAEILRELDIECEISLPGAWELARSGALPDSSPLSPIDWHDGGNLHAVNLVPGGTVNPGKLVSGLARAAARAGATIHEYARVESLNVDDAAAGRPMTLNIVLGNGNGARGDAAHRVQLRAQQVLLATNAQSLEISGFAQDAQPKFTLAVATAPLSAEQIADIGLSDGRPFYTVDFPYLWGRALATRGVIFGAGLVPVNDWRDLAEIDVAAGEAGEMIARIEQRVRGLHGALRAVEFTHRWGGPILFVEGMRPVFRALAPGRRAAGDSDGPANSSAGQASRSSQDSRTAVDLPATEDRRVLVLGAYAGHGVALSVYLGRWAAQALLGRRELPVWRPNATAM